MDKENINGVEVPFGTIVYEPRKSLDKAVVGFDGVLLYSYPLLLHVFIKMGMTYDEANDWISYNIQGMEGNDGFPKVIYDEEFKEEDIDEKFTNLLS